MPMPPRTDWKENVKPDDEERYAGYRAFILANQKARAAGGALRRALHSKTVAGVKATFTVLPNLPEHARVGIFATPGEHGAWVRFSNGDSHVYKDARPDARGMAIKILDVPGKKILAGQENETTHDILMVHAPLLPFRDADDFIFFVKGAMSPWTLVPKMIKRFGWAHTKWVLATYINKFAKRVPSVAEQQYWSTVPMACGAYAVQCSAKPVTPPQPPQPPSEDPNYFHADLAARLAKGPVEYDFTFQFYVDPEKTPIENATVEWSEEISPPVTVARLVLPQQDLLSEEGKRIYSLVDSMAFDSWQAPVDFRPLGDINRARKLAYQPSRVERKAAPDPGASTQPGA